MPILFLLLVTLSSILGCASRTVSFSKVDSMLDDFHRAAEEADETRYFNYFTEKAVFLGTDPDERWTKKQFRKYTKPYFSKGKGWRYKKIVRHISVEEDGMIAWFDEKLFNKKYGIVRGTGVLVLQGDGWKVAQYNLAIPIPNSMAKEVTKKIRKIKKN